MLRAVHMDKIIQVYDLDFQHASEKTMSCVLRSWKKYLTLGSWCTNWTCSRRSPSPSWNILKGSCWRVVWPSTALLYVAGTSSNVKTFATIMSHHTYYSHRVEHQKDRFRYKYKIDWWVMQSNQTITQCIHQCKHPSFSTYLQLHFGYLVTGSELFSSSLERSQSLKTSTMPPTIEWYIKH